MTNDRTDPVPSILSPQASQPIPLGLSYPVDEERLDTFLADVHAIAAALTRIADHVDPRPDDIVGTPYIAQKLGCTTAWITDLIKQGAIPKSCIVEGTGNGKVWKFHRQQIDDWISRR